MGRATHSDSNVSLGPLRLAVDDGVLTITGTHAPVQLAAFQGPGMDVDALGPKLEEVKATSPSLIVMLGGVGDAAETATRNIAALAALRLPVVVVPGGRDEMEPLEDAFDELSGDATARVFDASRLRKIVVGGATFIPVAGAPRGRYARTAHACGFEQSDLDARDDVLGRAGSEKRFLLSWAAPRGEGARGVSRGLANVDAGDAMLLDFASRVGARGGLFAWPSDAAMLPMPHDGSRVLSRSEAAATFRLVVPALTHSLPRDDGGSVRAGFALVEVRSDGLAFVGP